MKTIICVSQHRVTSNTKTKANAPVLTVKTYKDMRYAHEAVILDKEGVEVARIIYRRDTPAGVWIETQNKVQVIQHGFDLPNPLTGGLLSSTPTKTNKRGKS